MKKTFDLTEIDCADCARKIEERLQEITGVQSASVNFLAQKLTLEAEEADFPGILKQAQKVCRRVEPDCRILM